MVATLNNGITMPLLGLGVYDAHGKEAEQAVLWALETGYRLIDTATIYHNETETGNAIRQSGLPREEIFLTTKVWNTDQGYDKTMRAFDASEKRLNCDYIDLYLVHWPVKPTRRDTWKALETLYREKRVRSVGVSNYLPPFMEELFGYAELTPAVNQVEFSPYLYLKDLLDLCRQRGVVLQAYSPLARGQRMNDPKLTALAEKHGKTPAQVMLRWILQHGVSAIPKSANLKRLQENFDVFDFRLSDEDMAAMDTFNENFRVVDDPMVML
jgi:diketogulonate reductase-like aldo/keto reductase